MLSGAVVIGTVLEVVTTERADFLIVEDVSDPKYPNKVACEFFGEKNVAKLNGVEPGMLVRVDGRIRSREWEGKWFTSFNAFGLQLHQGRAVTRSGARDGGSRSAPARGRQEPPPGDDDVPF